MINLRSTSGPQSASFEASRVVSQAILLGNIGESLARDGEEDGQQRAEHHAASDSMEIARGEEGKQWSAPKSGEDGVSLGILSPDSTLSQVSLRASV